MDNPKISDVVSLRETIQLNSSLGITSAQDKCANMLHTSRRTWQQWEKGDRKMHPAFWELIKIKCAMHTNKI